MSGVPYSDAEIDQLWREYPTAETAVIAQRMGRSVLSIRKVVKRLGIRKDEGFRSAWASRRIENGYRPWDFIKGHQFVAKDRPSNLKPIGHERLCDGYLQRKVSDTGIRAVDWVNVHVHLWEQANGPVPPAHIVCFKDGDKSHIELDNLECIPKAELIPRYSLNNLPGPLQEVIRLKAFITRKINEHDR